LHLISDLAAEPATAWVTDALSTQGIAVRQCRESRFSLEDVFISVVEQAREQGKVAVEL